MKNTERVRAWVEGARRVVALTGAGISTDSGIPDFRGPQGVWTRNPAAEKMSDIRYYLADSEVRKASWQNRLVQPGLDRAAQRRATLPWSSSRSAGKLHALITQNIDELHQGAGNSPERVIEVHGTMRRFMCFGCGMRGPMPLVLERVRAGEDDPPCRDCGGILKSDTISFGQQLVPEVIDRAMRAAAEADLLHRRRHQPPGLPDRGRRGDRARRGREDRDRERRADAVRRRRRRGVQRADQRSAAADHFKPRKRRAFPALMA